MYADVRGFVFICVAGIVFWVGLIGYLERQVMPEVYCNPNIGGALSPDCR